MTPHTPRLNAAIALIFFACTGKEPPDTDATGTPPQDTAPADTDSDTDTGEEDLPDRLPFNGTITATVGSYSCTGPAEAVIIGALNIAGNAECAAKDGTTFYATISGTRDKDSSAEGTVAIDKSSTEWAGVADASSLSGKFSGDNIQGSFSLKATPEK